MDAAARWTAAHFDPRAVGRLPFSFRYGGRPSHGLLAAWKAAESVRVPAGPCSERTLTLTDSATGLAVRCVATAYHDFPALEWVLYFKNTGTADTPILEQVQALDAEFGPADDRASFHLHYAEGSHEKITDFQPLEKALRPGESFRLSSFGGRSSDGAVPLVNLASAGAGGVVLGVGWTGQWAASFSRVAGAGVRVQAGMEVTHLRLRPGEEIRTPAILALFWSGADRRRGQNLLRRLLLAHYTPTVGGAPVEPPIAASPHAIIGFEATTEANMVRMIENVARNRAPIDTWWIDTGWFTCPPRPGGWAGAVGNWEPDPARYPRGLKPVADAAHAAGLRFLLWIEPERVMRDTWLYGQHPQWLLKPSSDVPAGLRYQITDGFHLLDLGHPAALAWLKGKLSRMIRDVGIDVYRNDFNMYPLWYWRNDEPVDRQGMREIRYVTGLYDLWDTLRREHPRLLIDNCASGGRRIDFETLRRALVLTRSDYLWDPIGQQCHTYGLAQWVPITGIGAAGIDPYECRSGLGSHFALAADFSSQAPAVWSRVTRALEEQRSLRPMYLGDFYPLGTYSTAKSDWMAWQFHRADLGSGLVQAFRRQDCAAEAAAWRLCALEAEAEYRVVNLDDPKPARFKGRDLMQQGLTIRLPARPGAALITYERMPHNSPGPETTKTLAPQESRP